jgi:hypothetical protein
MTDRLNVGERGHRVDTRFRGDDPAQDVVDGRAVISQRRVFMNDGLAFGLQPQEGMAADPLDQTSSQPPVGIVPDPLEIGLDDLEPDGGRPAVENEYVDLRLLAMKPRDGT